MLKQINVFISYSRSDKSWASRLCEDLQQQGFTTWIDQENIQSGKQFDEEISLGVKECTHVLFLMTPASLQSTHVLNEIAYAHHHGKVIIPLKVKDLTHCEIPLLVIRLQSLDCTNYTGCFNRLIKDLKLDRNLSGVGVSNLNDQSAILPVDKEHLEALGAVLAQNQVCSAFPPRRALHPLQTILKNGRAIEKEKRTRNILILGVGCSKNVHDSIPLTAQVVKEIQEKFNGKHKFNDERKSFLTTKLASIIEKHKLDSNNLEAHLLALALADKQLVLEVLKWHYDLHYPVSLFYEITAHLFKHRFIDVIINYSIDEMLDNAIEEEMGTSDRKFIFSDAQFLEDKEDLLLNKRLKNPIYIKPNGTISHPSTLRFLREDFFEASQIGELISFLIEGKTEGDTHLDTNLIVAGFTFNNWELQSIVAKQAKKERFALYHFDFFGSEHDGLEERGLKQMQELLGNRNCFLFSGRDTGTSCLTLNDWFFELWQKTIDQFNEEYRPKDISRHVIVHEMFHPISDILINAHRNMHEFKAYRFKDYLRDRIYMELAIELFNSNDGIINLKQLAESRVGTYFFILKREDKEASLVKFLEAMELKRYKGFLEDTWWFNAEDTSFRKGIVRRVSTHLSDKIKLQLPDSKDRSHRFWVAVDQLSSKRSLLLNIQPRSREAHLSIFQHANDEALLTTDVKWTYTFKKYFLDDELVDKWNLVIAISETGGIFTEPAIKERLGNKKMMLICAYNGEISKKKRREQLLNGKLKDLRSSLLKNHDVEELRLIPFRAHNQHIVLFIKVDQSGEMHLYKGIYYNRRAMTKSVSPLHITMPHDLNALLNIFLNYWDRARTEDENDLIKDMVDRIQSVDMEREFSNLKRELILLKNELSNRQKKGREEFIRQLVELFLANTK